MRWPLGNLGVAFTVAVGLASLLPLMETGGEATTPHEESDQGHETVDATHAAPAVSQTGHGAPEESGQEMTLVQQLKGRLQQLEARERSLREEEQRLEQLRRDLQVLAEQQAKQAAMEREAQQAEAEKPPSDPTQASLKHLVKVYEAMDPDEAAARIGKMNERLALDILARVKDKKAAGMLAGIEPAKAARLSEGLRSYLKEEQKRDDR